MAKSTNLITLEGDARKRALASVKTWAASELDLTLSDLKAEMFVDYIVAEFGPAFFNLGASVLRQVVERQLPDAEAAIQRDEFPTWGRGKRESRSA